MQIFSTNTVTQFISGITSLIASNIGTVLGVFAVIVGLSVVLALFDENASYKALERRRWK